MSSDIVVAKRYAKALFEVAQQHDQIGQVEEELQAVSAAVETNAELKKFILHPNIDAATKMEMFQKALQGKVSEILLRTVQLLIEKGRITMLNAVLEAYVAISNEALGQANAIVYTPSPLSESETKRLAEQFGGMTGKKIRLSFCLDKGLLGGVKVRIGDRLYDGSLSGKLAALEKTLLNSNAI